MEIYKLEFIEQLFHKPRVSKGCAHPLVGFLGATPLNRCPQTAKCLTSPAGVLQAHLKGEFRNCVAKEGFSAREKIPNSNEVAAFV